MSIDATPSVDPDALSSAVNTFKVLQSSHPDLRVASLDQLLDSISEHERLLVLGVCALDASAYGVAHTPIPVERDADLVEIDRQPYIHDGRPKFLGIQYVTKEFDDRYSAMNAQMHRDLGRGVLIQSGYRSPAYQAITFIRQLHQNQGDIAKTIKVVAPPFHSEHNDTDRLAADLMRSHIDGPDNNFSITDEYCWLTEHADAFGLELSYPDGNDKGVAFEPWHWRQADK